METRLGPAVRYVDPVLQHWRRHYVGHVRDLVPSCLLKMALNTVSPFSLPRRLVLNGSSLMLVQAIDIF